MSDLSQVCVVDDDEGVLDSLRLFLASRHVPAHCFSSAAGFLDALAAGLQPSCLVTDVRMPRMTGLDLQRELKARRCTFPIIFITGHGDVPIAVAALRNGARDFLEKPFDEQQLLQSIRDAVAATSQRQAEQQTAARFAGRIAELSNRQLQVMELAVQGLSNKEIAEQLGLSPRTVESYRAWVMEKTGAHNLADLVRMTMLVEAETKRQ